MRSRLKSRLALGDNVTAVAAIREPQRLVCRRFSALPDPPDEASKVGVSRDLRDEALPLNGLRHPPTSSTNGWYLWRGGEPSEDEGFFVPLHIEHIASWCPAAIPYLALPPGWRFLVVGTHEDVWFDDALVLPPDR
jgi:hypothetical protein